jgi:ATP-dependent helicase/nuclease subunit B
VDEGVLAQAEEEMKDQPQLSAKLHDLLIIRRAFVKALSESYITAEDLMPELTRLVHTSEFLKNSVLVLDGFADFTPAQFSLMGELLCRCREVYVVLDMTRKQFLAPRSENALFHLSRGMIDGLSSLAEKAGVPVAPPIWLSEDQDHYESEELRFLERHYEQAQGVYSKPTTDLLFLEADTPNGEVEQVCAQILKLAREQGMHYRDMAIITTDLHTYGDILERKLLQAGVPFFSDNRHNLSGNIGVQTLLFALEAVEKNFTYETVFCYLKSGLFPERYMIDLMENYCIAAGIRGLKNFQRVWEWRPETISEEELAQINAQKGVFLEPLFALNGSIKGKMTVKQRVQALRSFMEQIRFQEQMESLSAELVRRGELELAQEYQQVQEQIETLFSQMEEMIGQERISLKELSEILETGFSEISVGVVPPTLDSLVIADMRRSRLADVKVVFVMGMNEGSFPSMSGGAGILNDADREQLKECHVALAPTAKKESLADRFHIYRTFTKPSKRLYFSCSRQNTDGKTLRPSYVLGQIRRLFPALTSIPEGVEIYHVRQGLEALAAGNMQETAALRSFYAEQPEYAGMLAMIDRGRNVKHVEEYIAPQTAGKLFAQPPLTSVTHLEQFAACQMAHFLKYGLHLKVRQEHQLRNLDMGNLYHEAFDIIFRRIGQEGLDFGMLQEEQKDALVEEGISQALEHFSSDLFDSSSKNDYTRTRMREILRLNLDAVLEQLSAGAYSNVKTELAFGMKGSEQHPPMRLEDSAFSLMGKIDRLDEAKGADGSSYLRVVDYKTGNTRFDFTGLMNGLQLQLMLYLSSAVEMKSGTRADGAFYYHIDEPVVELSAKEAAELAEDEKKELIRERQLQQLRMNGVLNSEEESVRLFETNLSSYQTSRVLEGLKLNKNGGFAASAPVIPERYMGMLMDEAKEQTVKLGDAMLTGAIDTNPYLYKKKKPCTYCEFSQVCGFNIGFSGYHYRRLQEQRMMEVLGSREAQSQEE